MIDENSAPYIPPEIGTTCYHCPHANCDGHFYLSMAELGTQRACSKCGLVVTIGPHKESPATHSSEGENMKTTLNIAGALLVLMGAIWFLQGINVLPGSFMTGQIRWAVYGGIAVAVGIALVLAANRRRNGGR